MSMARVVVPYSSPTDGDVLFLCSTEALQPSQLEGGRQTSLASIGCFLTDVLHQAVFSVFTFAPP